MKMIVYRTILFLIISSACLANDWPVWRGPQANRISPESKWRPSALKPRAKIIWRGNVGSGHSSFAIRSGKLYTMGNIDNQDFIYCLDAKTGREIWKFRYDSPKGNYGGPRSTPVLDGNYLYTLSREGKVHCIDVANRSVKWTRDIVKSEGIKIPTWGLASSAIIEGNLVLFNAGKHGIALNKKNGNTVWAGPGSETSYASPVIYTSGQKKCAAIFSAKSINAVEVRSGKLLWSYPWRTKHDVNAADPVVADKKMFISSGYNTGACLLDISGGKPKKIWQNKSMANHFNSCVLLDGHLYGVSGNTGTGQLVCLEFATGKEKWRHGRGYEGLMAADGKLIIMDKKGFLTIAAATPNGYSEIASSQVLTDRSAKNWTVPVLANGFIYCRNSNGDIACVNVN